MSRILDSLLAAYEKTAVPSKMRPKNARSLRKAVRELAAAANASVPSERRVTVRDVETVAARSLNRTVHLERESRFFAAYKEVASFIALATTGKSPVYMAQNRDLLPIGHPLSTRRHAMTASAYVETVANWLAADPRIGDEQRPLVAAIYRFPVDSVEYAHAAARLSALPAGLVPQDILVASVTPLDELKALVAVGGNDSIAKSIRARNQNRDRRGRFAEEFGSLKFSVRLGDGRVVSVVGKFAGNSQTGEGFLIEVSGDSNIPDGIYDVPASKAEAIQAILPESAVPDTDVEVTPALDEDVVDIADLKRLDFPPGWELVSEKAEGEDGPDKVFRSDDGFLVDYFAPGNPALKNAVQQAWKYNTPPGAKFGNPPDVRNAAGESQFGAKLDTSKPVFVLWRDKTDVTSKKSVAITQNWADTQAYAAKDEEKFEAEYQKGLEAKAKQEESAAKSKAYWEAQKKEVAEQNKQKAQDIAEIRANLAKRIDPFGNMVPNGWNITVNEGWLAMDENEKDAIQFFPLRREEIATFTRTEQGFTQTLRTNKDGTLSPLNNYKQEAVLPNWEAADKAFAEAVEKDVNARRQAAFDFLDKYDKSGKTRQMLEDGASYDDIIAELEKDEGFKYRKGDYDTRWAAEIPSADEKKAWAEFGKGLDAVQNFPEKFQPFETNKFSEPGEAKSKYDGIYDKMVALDADLPPEEFLHELFDGAKSITGEEWKKLSPGNEDYNVPDDADIFYIGEDRVLARTWAGNWVDYTSDGEEIDWSKNGEDEDVLEAFDNAYRNDLIGNPEPAAFYQGKFVDDELQSAFEAGMPDEDEEPEPKATLKPKKKFDFSKRLNEILDSSPTASDKQSFFDKLFDGAKFDDASEYDEEYGLPEGAQVYFENEGVVLAKYPDGTWHEVNPDGEEYDFEDSFPNLWSTLLWNDGDSALPFYQGAMVDKDLQNAIEDARAELPETDENPYEDGGPEPTTPSAPSAPAAPEPKAVIEEEEIEWILPGGAFNLYKADEYEPEGRIDQESSNYTDDPKTLANRFSTETLRDALRQAIIGLKPGVSPDDDDIEDIEDLLDDMDDIPEEEGAKKKPGPKKKKPKPQKIKAASGFGSLEFSDGDEFVPAEAIYSALKEQGEDVDMMVAEIYDELLSEPKNVEMLEALRSGEEVGLPQPSSTLDEFDKDVQEIIDTNEMLARSEVAMVAVAQIEEMLKNGESNQSIKDVAAAIAEFDQYDENNTTDILSKHIAWALNGTDEEKQAFRGLWSLLLSADGGYTEKGIDDSLLFMSVRNALQGYNGSEPTTQEIQRIFDEFGYFEDLLASKKRVADGDETLDMPNSPAGAMYRLIAAMTKPNTSTLYRGIQVPIDSEELDRFVEGGIISIDPRSFTIDKALAGKFAGAFGGNDDKASVIFTIRAGNGTIADISMISMFGEEREELAWGNFRVKSVQSKINAAGKMLYNVELERINKRETVLEGYSDEYNELLLENEDVELPGEFYTPSTDAHQPSEDGTDDPLMIARSYESEDLIGAFRGAIEDGEGKVLLQDENGDEYVVDVEAVRDALQIQGIDTNELLRDIANTDEDVEASDEELEAIEPVSEDALADIIEEFGTEYDLEGLEQVGPQQGSNKGGTFKDADGNEYYVKEPKSELHRRNELLASAFYKLLKINAAEMRFGSGDDGKEKIFSSIIPGDTLDKSGLVTADEIRKKIQIGFAVDAWLANWDVAGLVNDNIIVTEDGEPFRIDTGGALLFRAMGAPKGSAFGNEVPELDTLRDNNMNPTSAAIFGDMTEEELKASAAKLLDVSHSDIDELVDATMGGMPEAQDVKDKLKARRQYILNRFDLSGDDTSIMKETAKDPIAEMKEKGQWYDGSGAAVTPDGKPKSEKSLINISFTPLDDGSIYEDTQSEIDQEDLVDMTEKDLIDTWLEINGIDPDLFVVDEITKVDGKTKVSFMVDPEELDSARKILEGKGLAFDDSGSTTPPSEGETAVDFDGADKYKIPFDALYDDEALEQIGMTSEEAEELSPEELVQKYLDAWGLSGKVRLEKVDQTFGGYEATVAVPDDAKEALAKGYNYDDWDALAEDIEKVDVTPPAAPSGTSTNFDDAERFKIPFDALYDADALDEIGVDSDEAEAYSPRELVEKYLEKWGLAGRVLVEEVTDTFGGYEAKVAVPDDAKEDLAKGYNYPSWDDFLEDIEQVDTSEVPESPADEPAPAATEVLPSETPGNPYVTSDGVPIEPGMKLRYKKTGETVEFIKYDKGNSSYVYVKMADGKIKVKSTKQLESISDNGDGGPGDGGPTPEPEPEAPSAPEAPQEPTPEPEPEPEPTPEPEVVVPTETAYISGSDSVEDRAKAVQEAIDKKQGITFYYNGKLRHVTPESIWENPKNGNLNIYGADLDAEGKKKNFTVQLIETPPVVEPSAPEKKPLQAHAQWIQDLLKGQGVEISDEKAIAIRDAINEEVYIKWSSAIDSEIMEAIDDVVGSGKISLQDAPEEKPEPSEPKQFLTDETRNTVIGMIMDLAQYPGFTKELYVNKISHPAITEADGQKMLEDLKKIQADFEKPAETPSTPEPEEVDETPEPEAEVTEPEAPKPLGVGSEIIDKGGKKGTVSKGPNKDNYVFVEFDDGTKGWRSVNSLQNTGNFTTPTQKAAKAKKPGKPTGAGAPPVIIESPADWSTSEIEGTPSLTDAISKTLSDAPGAGLTGASAMIDSDAIEDLDVRVMRVVDENGEDGIQLKFKLTSWASKDLITKLMKMTPEERIANGVKLTNFTSVPRLTIDKATQTAVLDPNNPIFQGPGGNTWTITTQDGIVIRIHRGNKDAGVKVAGYGSSRAFHNMVQIQAPANATTDQIANALALAGVEDVRPATPADARILAENRLMSIFDRQTDATKNLKGADREASLERIKTKYGITADDVTFTTGASGRIETRLSEEGARKIVKATGEPTVLQHQVHVMPQIPYTATPEEKEEILDKFVIDMLTGPQGGLLSTTVRRTEGISSEGLSSGADIISGGGDYVFMRPLQVPSALEFGITGQLPHFYFDPVKMYQRLDFYANRVDNGTGKRFANTDVISEAKVGAYEVMFKHRVGWDNLSAVLMSPAQALRVRNKLKAMGITEIGGQPIEKIITAGTKNPLPEG